MQKPIAVVTGGAGFIGSHMVDVLLDRGYLVRVIDNFTGGHEKNLSHQSQHPNLQVEHKDILILHARSSLFKNASYVFHFAGIGDIVPSIEEPEKYMLNNVMGTVKVL